MLAKAVAHHTTASFIRVVGSEFVQKYLGEGPRMVGVVEQLRTRGSVLLFLTGYWRRFRYFTSFNFPFLIKHYQT